jgi:hypothetical protein
MFHARFLPPFSSFSKALISAEKQLSALKRTNMAQEWRQKTFLIRYHLPVGKVYLFSHPIKAPEEKIAWENFRF